MSRFTAFVITPLFILVIFSCGTMRSVPSSAETIQSAVSSSSGKPGIIVKRTDTEQYMSMTIYIDGKYSGSIPAGGIAEFDLSNGQHSIYIASLSTTRSNLLTIKVDNDKHFFKAIADSYIRYILIEESVESIGITDYSLLDTAINNTFNTISQNIPQNARIAIVNISSVNNNDQPEANFIMEELSVLMVNSKKFTVVDRQTLDTIRMEQNFQMTGEVGDDSAISIGKFLGANVVITGSIAGAGNQRRLRLKALDVLTAQVLAMSSYGI